MTLGAAGTGTVKPFTHGVPGSGHMEGKEEVREGPRDNGAALKKIMSSLAWGV